MITSCFFVVFTICSRRWSDVAKWLSQKPPMPPLHYITSLHHITSYITSFQLISSSPSGCLQVCVLCTRISDKVPGTLDGTSAGVTRELAEFARFSRYQKKIMHKLPDFGSGPASRSRSNDQMPNVNFRPQQMNCRTFISDLYVPFMIHVPLATSSFGHDHVTTQHSRKQHHAVASLSSVVACLLSSRKL